MSRVPPIPGPEGVPSSQFAAAYGADSAAWCIGRPQPVVVDVLARGWLSRGPILDSGCGSGENLVEIAACRPGLEIMGVDLVDLAIERARALVRESGLESRVRLETGDLGKACPEGRFGSVLDAGVLHVFSDRERRSYLAGLHEALEPGGELVVIVFSDAEESPGGPRRLGREELSDCLETADFKVVDFETCRYDTTRHAEGARAWLVRSHRS